MNSSHAANFRRKKKRQWKPISIEDVPFRRQDRMTLNARNRMDRDRKLIFFIVGLGVLMIVIGLLMLLIYKVYNEDSKHIRPVIVIGPCLWQLVLCVCSSLVKCVSVFINKRKKFLIPTWTTLRILMKLNTGWILG